MRQVHGKRWAIAAACQDLCILAHRQHALTLRAGNRQNGFHIPHAGRSVLARLRLR